MIWYWSHFKLNVNELGILFTQILRIVDELAKIFFLWEKWNFEPFESSTYSAEFLFLGKVLKMNYFI